MSDDGDRGDGDGDLRAGPEWVEAGFEPFVAALAHADGYTPHSAAHYRAQLEQTATAWRAVGLANADGLRWHVAGYSARQAGRWRQQGQDVDQVQPAAGYGTAGLGRRT